jgi:cytochrome P450
MSVDLEYFEHHYAPDHPDLADNMWAVVDHLRTTCPVARSDAPMGLGGTGEGGFFVLTRYDDVFAVLQDWRTFSSSGGPRAAEAGQIAQMPPITTDPPLQRDFRRLMNPHLSPQAVAPHEPQIRQIVTELIDDFIEDGQCDLVGQLARLHPPRMLYRCVFGVDDEADLQRNLEYMKMLDPGNPSNFVDPDRAAALIGWITWTSEFMTARRAGPRRDDIIDALLHGTVEGRPLTDDEIGGAIRILILGGFFTTTDATSATMMQLIQHPELQDRLRKDPSLIPGIFDEVLRIEPPVISMARTCTRDTEVGGQPIKAGDSVLMHFGGANRDPAEFDRPADLEVDRQRNHHRAFGGGPHRCIGSNVARLNLRIVFEEILDRMHDIRITPGDAPRHARPGLGWGLEYLPITFTPGPRLGRR